jgi:outer membrane protein assembly factor BamB
MKSYPALRRWLAVAGTVAVFALILGVLSLQQSQSTPPAPQPTDAGGSTGRSWPMFGGHPSRNLVNTVEKNVPTTWSVKDGAFKNIKWMADLGSKAYGGPVIAGGKIYVGTNNQNPRNPQVKGDKGILMCFRESDGSFLWQAIHDKLPAGRVNDWPLEGICSSPFVEGNRLYYVSNRSEVVCADTEGFLDGKNDGAQDEKYKGKTDADFIWRLDMIKELNNFPHNLSTCSPLVVGDTLFVITSNGVDEGHINIPQPDAPSFLAIDKKTGKVKWKNNDPTYRLVEAQKAAKSDKGNQEVTIKELVDKGLLLMHGQWSNPVYAEPNGKPMIIFPGGDGWIHAFHPADGKLLWKFDCNPKSSFYKLGGEGTRNDFVSTPVIWENKLYIGVGQDPEHKKGVGHLWCIDITKEPKNSDRDLSPVKDNFDPKAPENKDSGLVWHYGGEAPADYDRDYLFGRTLSTCAVHDGLLYTSELDGIVHCIDARTGKQYWEHDMRADTWSSPYWVDGKVYIGNDKGRILIFQHGKEKKLLGEIEMGKEAKVRATPTVVNGVLYVMTENPCRLYAITNK